MLTLDLYKNILDNIELPVAIFDASGKLVYSNAAFASIVGTDTDLVAFSASYNDNFKLEKYDDYSIVTMLNKENRAHQDFISTVSHELRTPLTSIRGFADTMLLSPDKLSKEQTIKFLSIIRNQADRLTRLVENLLKVSNISKKENMIFKEMDFKKFIVPLITLFEKKYTAINFQLDIQRNLPALWTDADSLEQIMTNLLDNAAKYSSGNALVKIQANYLNDFIEIKVFDEAVKIPQDKLEKIFEKFTRITNPLTQKVEGTGLGLFITKALVQKLKGSICAQNYENGNVFLLKLPVASIEKNLEYKLLGDK